jgi:hypothetical protein
MLGAFTNRKQNRFPRTHPGILAAHPAVEHPRSRSVMVIRMKLPSAHLLWPALLMLALIAVPARADESRFAQCRNDLQVQAANAGLSAALLERTLGTARYQQRVIDLDRRQPEFTDTAANYLNRRVTDQRIAQGRELLQRHQQLLQRMARNHGVAPQYLLASWGLESNFGATFGSIPVEFPGHAGLRRAPQQLLHRGTHQCAVHSGSRRHRCDGNGRFLGRYDGPYPVHAVRLSAARG